MLFHELVHTVQYRLLGVPAFARRYVKGFLATKRYRDIPLERCALHLQFQFETKAEPFQVEAEVAHVAATGSPLNRVVLFAQRPSSEK